MARWLWWLLCGLVLCGCPGPAPEGGEGRLDSDLDAELLRFEGATVGRKSSRLFQLSNVGKRGAVRLLGIQVKGPDGIFSVSKLSFPVELAAGQSQDVEVHFLPQAAQEYSGELWVQAENADNLDAQGAFKIALQSAKAQAAASLSWGCLGLDFGSRPLGAKETRTCELRNDGARGITLKAASYKAQKGDDKAFRVLFPKLPVTLGVGQRAQVRVEFGSPSPGEHRGSIGLETEPRVDAPPLKVAGSTPTLSLVLVPLYPPCQSDGQCRAIALGLSCKDDAMSGQKRCLAAPGAKPRLRFPPTLKGKSSRRVLALRNLGERPVKIDQIGLEPGSADFKLSSLALPFALAPGGEKQLAVEYIPSGAQQGAATVVVYSDDPVQPKASASLEVASRGCALVARPDGLSFEGKGVKSLSLSAVGNESCVLSRIYLKSEKDRPFYLSGAPKAGATLVPNGSSGLRVHFEPAAAGSYKDVLVVELADLSTPALEIPLDGIFQSGPACALEATPTALDFGFVPSGKTRPLSVELHNKGWGACDVKSLELLGLKPTGHKAFSWVTTKTAPFAVGSQQKLRLELLFAPSATAQAQFEGEISLDIGASESFRIELRGQTGQPCILAFPEDIDFGITKAGCGTRSQSLQFFHSGAPGCPGSIQVTGAGWASGASASFRLRAAPGPVALSVGKPLSVELSYKPKATGLERGYFELRTANGVPKVLQVQATGEGVSVDDQKDVFRQQSRPKVDILFVMDDSCSMGDEQAALASNASSFLNWANRNKVEYHIGVITTDATGRPSPAGCLRGQTKIVTPTTPNGQATFAANLRVGTAGSAQEQGLASAYHALSAPATLGCNKGFLRSDALLHLIEITDEPDSSPRSLDFYRAFFKNLKRRQWPALLRFSTISGPPPTGCRSPRASAGASPRVWQLSQELQGQQTPICTQDWAQAASLIGASSFGYRSQFILRRDTTSADITSVKINGQPVANTDWSYDLKTRSLRFGAASIPAPGSTVEVLYKGACLP